jgi:hypothetical protein
MSYFKMILAGVMALGASTAYSQQSTPGASVATNPDLQKKIDDSIDLQAARLLILTIASSAEVRKALSDELETIQGKAFKAGASLTAEASAMATGFATLRLLSNVLSFEAPGIHTGVNSNPSSIIGEPAGFYTYRVTAAQAYGPIAGFTGASIFGALITSEVQRQGMNPANSALGRKILNLDSKYEKSFDKALDDLAYLLEIKSEDRLKLKDALREELMKLNSLLADENREDDKIDIDVLALIEKMQISNPKLLESLRFLNQITAQGASSQVPLKRDIKVGTLEFISQELTKASLKSNDPSLAKRIVNVQREIAKIKIVAKIP